MVVKVKRGIKMGLAVMTVLVALAAVYLAAVSGSEAEVVEVKQDTITLTVDETGYVQSARDYSLYASQSARVVAVNAVIGDTVQKGQRLLTLDNIDLALQMEQVRSQLDQAHNDISAGELAVTRSEIELKDAEKNLTRMETLYQSAAISEVDYEQAQKTVEISKQNLNEITKQAEGVRSGADALSRQLQKLTAKEGQLDMITPMGGMVLDLPVKQGQIVQPGQSLATVAAPDILEVKADILIDDVAALKPGQPVLITAPVLGEQVLPGLVQEIYPRAEEKQSALGVTQRRVPVIISLGETGNLKPGYEVKVAIQIDERANVSVVPREALRTTATGEKEVMVVQDNRVYHRAVQIGIGDGEKVEILTGLKAGDLLVKDGSRDLPEKVKIKPISPPGKDIN